MGGGISTHVPMSNGANKCRASERAAPEQRRGIPTAWHARACILIFGTRDPVILVISNLAASHTANAPEVMSAVHIPSLHACRVGLAVGLAVGFAVGCAVGFVVGFAVGFTVGWVVGLAVGSAGGGAVGFPVGFPVGLAVGVMVGLAT